MDVRPATHPTDFSRLTPTELRDRFLVQDLFAPGKVRWALSQQDRLVLGGVVPDTDPLVLEAPPELRTPELCDRRELGVVCLAGPGVVHTDDKEFTLVEEDILYLGRGTTGVSFSGRQARFYLVSAPAHERHPSALVRREDAETVALGHAAAANVRTLRKYVHEQGVTSSELALGITTIEPGSVWNTMPCHTHDRRTEVYLYSGLGDHGRVVHLCGPPDDTRSIVVANDQAVISPPWSVHFGAGTQSYRFVWSTAGENLAYDDMDPVDTRDLR